MIQTAEETTTQKYKADLRKMIAIWLEHIDQLGNQNQKVCPNCRKGGVWYCFFPIDYNEDCFRCGVQLEKVNGRGSVVRE